MVNKHTLNWPFNEYSRLYLFYKLKFVSLFFFDFRLNCFPHAPPCPRTGDCTLAYDNILHKFVPSCIWGLRAHAILHRSFHDSQSDVFGDVRRECSVGLFHDQYASLVSYGSLNGVNVDAFWGSLDVMRKHASFEHLAKRLFERWAPLLVTRYPDECCPRIWLRPVLLSEPGTVFIDASVTERLWISAWCQRLYRSLVDVCTMLRYSRRLGTDYSLGAFNELPV